MILEVAAGVVLGGIVLYVLYEFREEIAKLLLWPFWGTIIVAGLTLIGTVGVGAWRIGERIFGHITTKPTIPEGLFGWAVLIGLFFLPSWKSIVDGIKWLGQAASHMLWFSDNPPRQ